MTLRSQRTYPLSFTGSSINTGIVGAYDWAGDPNNSRAGGNGVDHSGLTHPWNAPTTTPTVVANIGGVAGQDGRDTTIGATTSGNYYKMADLANLGCNFGTTGAYSFWWRVRTPSVAVATTQAMQIAQNKNAAGAALLFLGFYEVTTTGKYHPRITVGATQPLEWSTSGNTGFAPGAVVDVHVTRSAAGVVKCFVGGVKLATGSDTTDWTAGGVTATNNVRGNSSNGTRDFVLIDEIVWNRELSEAEVTAQQANPYGYYTNSAPADSLTVTSPANGASLGTSFTVSGTTAGGNAAGSIEASFNGGAYVTIATGVTAGASWSGTMSGVAAGTGNLVVRWTSNTAINATVSSVTVTGASITFDPIGTLTTADASRAVPYKMYQADASNQATARIKGTCSGITGNLEYRWNGGTWTTGKAAPVGASFDFTVVLQGPNQGSFDLRDSASVGVTSSLPYIGVGDVYGSAGQSQLVGKASGYVVPVAPGAHPTWIAVEMTKDNVWKPLRETSTNPYDDRTGNVYTTAFTTEAVAGSLHGALATLVMATGRPFASIPCAQGSTGIGQWAVGGPLYTATLNRMQIAGATKLFMWDGETDANAGVSQSTFQTALDTILNGWFTSGSINTVLININDQALTGTVPIRAAIAAVAGSNTHVKGLADMLGAWTGYLHYDSPTDINAAALRVFNAAYPGPAITVQPVDQSVIAGTTVTVSVTATSPTGSATYQWQRSTDLGASYSNISGATGTSYAATASLTGGAVNSGDRLRCVISNVNGSITSSAATITVTTATATLTITGFQNYAGAAITSVTIPVVEIFNPAAAAGSRSVLSLTNQTVNSSGTMTITSTSLVAGTTYLVVCSTATGASRGAKAFTAA